MIKALLCKGRGLKIRVKKNKKKTVFRDKSGLALLDVELYKIASKLAVGTCVKMIWLYTGY